MRYLILIIVIVVCSSRKQVAAQKQMNNLDSAYSNTYSIILTVDSAYAYVGVVPANVKRFEISDSVNLVKDLLAARKKIGKEKMIVLVKPSSTAYISRTMETIERVRRSIVEQCGLFVLSENDLQYFHLKQMSFDPSAPVEVVMPSSVVTETKYPDNNAVMITIGKNDRVSFTIFSKTDSIFNKLIEFVNHQKKLGLTDIDKKHFRESIEIGVGFSQLKGFLDHPVEEQKNLTQPGIPMDTTGGELTEWILAAKKAFSRSFQILIKRDNNSGYRIFKNVITALRKNEEYKYQLVTSNE